MFDDDAKKEDIEELKDWIAKNFSKSSSGQANAPSAGEPTLEDILEGHSEDENAANKKVETLEDEEYGEYKDSTVAKNFDTLQAYIDEQMESLNSSI